MAILNPICADCGHDLQHHYAGAGNAGCTDGDCQCAVFVSRNKSAEEMVGGKVTGVEQTDEGLTVTATPPENISVEYALAKINEGVWSVNRARQELGIPPHEQTKDVFPMLFNQVGQDAADDTMSTEEFTRLIEEQIGRSTSLLIDKAKEYASDIDRLHNFKVAAQLLGGTQEQALGGFLAKHIVSVFDMINSGKEYPQAVWNEKITDSINYLLILRAMQR
jgi:hypothetical protein